MLVVVVVVLAIRNLEILQTTEWGVTEEKLTSAARATGAWLQEDAAETMLREHGVSPALGS